ncbi:LOW QUALITY PROTEIN: hypothetical protein GGTG_07506 [Gaeumannomyces tritici R3-111a-1]|uniref:Uncharacterized protein n=1 Tax=Gaeumannomyces tritici (strain R3-111a-1) TaxID=644352 RepID=J3P1V8_GAET3|nr:LOW QUALITY PROTEIN: hypothetical protein GGTG_07506 [Gaeumannomyces tritici R3-111a-1]EJT73650.1 LOW QUALITY PROTEIN: hypothetical protein GGTG_07506 [Gaeumannomyces tritici R3-111a-1]
MSIRRKAEEQAGPAPLSTIGLARALVSRAGGPDHGSLSSDQSAAEPMDDQTLREALSQTSADAALGEATPAEPEYISGIRSEPGKSLRSNLKRLSAAVKDAGDRDFEKLHASVRGPVKHLSFTLAWFKYSGLYAPNQKYDMPPPPEMLVDSFNDFMADLNNKLASGFGTKSLPEDQLARYRLKSVLPENHTPVQFKGWPVLRIKFSAPLMRVKVTTRGRGPTLADATTAAIAGLYAQEDVRQLIRNFNRVEAVVHEAPPSYGLLRKVYTSTISAGDFPHIQTHQDERGNVLRVTKQKCRFERPIKIIIEAPRLGIKVEANEYIEKACRDFLEALESRVKSDAEVPDAPSSFGSVTHENARSILELRHPGCVFSFSMPRDLSLRRMGVQVVQCTRNSIPFGPSVLVSLPPIGKWKTTDPAIQKIAREAANFAYMAAAMYPFQGKAPIGMPSHRNQRRLELLGFSGESDEAADEEEGDDPAWPTPKGIDLSKPKTW